MADILDIRTEPGHPVFYYTGVDLFGPFLVKYGRGEVKRYGCLYTCLTTRAIHIEVLHSLETDTFLNSSVSVNMASSAHTSRRTHRLQRWAKMEQPYDISWGHKNSVSSSSSSKSLLYVIFRHKRSFK